MDSYQPRIEPIALSDIEPGLAEAINDSLQAGVLSSTFPLQIWAQRPSIAKHWLSTLNSFYRESLLDERLRELVRLKIASITQCNTCQLARKSDEVSDIDIGCLDSQSAHFTATENAALGFAEKFATDYLAIRDSDFDVLNAHFSSAAIVELSLFCGLMLAGGRITYVMNRSNAVPESGKGD